MPKLPRKKTERGLCPFFCQEAKNVKIDEAAIELANAIEADEDGADLGPTDAELCVKALRAYGRRRINRFRNAVLGALAVLPAIGVGLAADFNGSGTSTMADLAAGRNPFKFEEANAEVSLSQFIELHKTVAKTLAQ